MNRSNSLKKVKGQLKETILPNSNLSFLDRINRLEEILNGYITTAIANVPKESFKRLNFFWTTIRNCFILHQEGLSADAIQLFYNNIYSNKAFVDVYELVPDSKLYRIRTSEYGGLFSKEEMFHIPFDKRHLVLNNRSSVYGFPSLYLGESTYICWEEMGNPNFDTCNISMFSNNHPLSVINLSPIMEDFDTDKILKYPLAYICSLGACHHDSPFKEEYVIPQILMQCLLIDNKANPETSCVGIRYISNKAYTQRPLFPLNEKEDLKRYYNYAFPAFAPYDDMWLSKKLQSLFSWSAPETYGRLRLRQSNMPIEEARYKDTYGYSAFYQMENRCYLQLIHDNMLKYENLAGALSF